MRVLTGGLLTKNVIAGTVSSANLNPLVVHKRQEFLLIELTIELTIEGA